MTEEEMLTERQWRQRDLEKRCAETGHGPDTTIRTVQGPVKALCECGLYEFEARRTR